MSDRGAHELLLKETLARPVLLSAIAGYGAATYLSVALILSVVGKFETEEGGSCAFLSMLG